MSARGADERNAIDSIKPLTRSASGIPHVPLSGINRAVFHASDGKLHATLGFRNETPIEVPLDNAQEERDVPVTVGTEDVAWDEPAWESKKIIDDMLSVIPDYTPPPRITDPQEDFEDVDEGILYR